MISYTNDIIIQKSTIHIYFAVISEINIVAIIHIKRRGNPQVLPFPTKQLVQNSFFFCGI